MWDAREATGKALRKYLTMLEISLDRAKLATKKGLGWLGPLEIMPYRGFGTHARQYFKGRVLEKKRIGSPKEDQPWHQNLLAMYRRFASNEIPGVRVRGRFYGQVVETIADEEGFFDLVFSAGEALDASRLWHSVEVELIDRVVKKQDSVQTTGQVLVPPRQSAFGVISDIDDTVLETHATDLWRTARITFLRNARTRMPLPGVAAFYQALHRGTTGAMQNPLFYVSSSAWNLYDLLSDFFEINEIPAGPILLQDLGFANNKLINPGHSHKLDKIRLILDTYPDLTFVLIGDSGQKDPEIYREAVLTFPQRVKAVYIREVPRKTRYERLQQVRRELAEHGVEMLVIRDTAEATAHAIANGLIQPAEVPEIKKDVAADLSEERQRS
jgi:phosphatidate phosphatase APP1